MLINAYISHKYFNEIKYVLYHWFEVWSDFEVNYIKYNDLNTIIKFNDFTMEIENVFFEKKEQFELIRNDIDNGREYCIYDVDFINFFRTSEMEFEVKPGYVKLNLDVIGDIFFLLTDYQVLMNPKYDKYGRFLFDFSILKRYINRPVVNEIYKFITTILSKNKITVDSKCAHSIRLTHDVDHPFQYYKVNVFHFLKNLCGDVLLRKQFPLQRLKKHYRVKSKDEDPYYTFAELQKKEEKVNSVYFFYAGNLNFANPDYSISSVEIRKLIGSLKEDRSNKIGIHFGIGSSDSLKTMLSEKQQFELYAEQPVECSRFHYLSFKLCTPGLLEKAGVFKDSTVGYADRPGFRTGTCFSYFLYDLMENKMTYVRENPLIMMEGTLFDEQYCNYDAEQAVELINLLNGEIIKYGGLFTVLWHNHRLQNDDELKVYHYLLSLA